jgi:hypothetical protein
MATPLTRQTAHYRLLHFQPDPEDGDRVCIGVLLEEGRRYTVLCDSKFQKLRCVAPDFEPELVAFYLRDLEANLDRSSEPIEITLRRCAPQMIASEPRSLAAPITDMARQRLLERFVLPVQTLQVRTSADSKGESEASEHLRLFLRDLAPIAEATFIPNARPRELIGKNLPYVKPVAFAIRKPSTVVLVDAVDLRIMSPARAIAKANRIVHTFWQYGRLQSEGLFTQPQVKKVGIVMNGSSPKTEPYFDAHDYSFHQFNNEADVAVDTTSGEGTELLRSVLTAES